MFVFAQVGPVLWSFLSSRDGSSSSGRGRSAYVDSRSAQQLRPGGIVCRVVPACRAHFGGGLADGRGLRPRVPVHDVALDAASTDASFLALSSHVTKQGVCATKLRAETGGPGQPRSSVCKSTRLGGKASRWMGFARWPEPRALCQREGSPFSPVITF